MSSSFASPWSNSESPIKKIQRYRRKKAKREAQRQDPRVTAVEDNREYENTTRGNAQAYQRNMSTQPWNPFGGPKTDPSAMPKPSPMYDPTDW